MSEVAEAAVSGEAARVHHSTLAAADVLAAAGPASTITGANDERDAIQRRALALADATSAGLALLIAIAASGFEGRNPAIFFAVPLIILMAKILGLYDREELVMRKSTLDEAPTLFQLATLYALIIWIVDGFVHEGVGDRRELLVLWITLLLLLVALRVVARLLVRTLLPAERCLLVGDASTCDRMRVKMSNRGSVHAGVVAHVSVRELGIGGGESLFDSRELQSLAAKHQASRIIVAPASADVDEVLDIIRASASIGLKVSVVPRMLEVLGSSVEFDDVEGVPLLAMRRAGLTQSSRFVKRVVDVVASSIGLVVLSPLMAIIAIAIKLDSKGPVLFRQPRVGRDGEPFEMLKFRTMVDGADARKRELSHLNEAVGLFKIAKDPRITRAGAVLRQLSLDELPQLINVLRGDMSLVGPRPLILEEDSRVEGWHRRRLALTPGMTGNWQILGHPASRSTRWSRSTTCT